MIQLTPFNSTASQQSLKISAEVLPQNNDDSLHFVRFLIQGTLEIIHWPLKPDSGRHHELWKTTCFEVFLGLTSAPTEYFEVNVNPAGAWNCYHFSSYRQNMTESPDLVVQSQQKKQLSNTEIELTFTLKSSAPLHPALLHPTCVVQNTQGEVTYWASLHGEKPDFHAQDLWSPASALR